MEAGLSPCTRGPGPGLGEGEMQPLVLTHKSVHSAHGLCLPGGRANFLLVGSEGAPFSNLLKALCVLTMALWRSEPRDSGRGNWDLRAGVLNGEPLVLIAHCSVRLPWPARPGRKNCSSVRGLGEGAGPGPSQHPHSAPTTLSGQMPFTQPVTTAPATWRCFGDTSSYRTRLQ